MVSDPADPTPDPGLQSAAAGGVPLDLSVDGDDPSDAQRWHPRRRVAAADIHRLCTATDSAVHARGLHIIGAVIVGELDLDAANLHIPLVLEKCVLEEPMSIDRATVMHLSLTGSHIPRLSAEDLQSTTSVDLGGITCPGGISLRGASVGGFLSLANASLGEPDGRYDTVVVLQATGLHVARDLDLSEVTAFGSVTIDRAKVEGNFNCTGARFSASDPGEQSATRALSAVGCAIGGDADLTGVEAVGEVVLTNANIAGGLVCAHTRLSLRADEMARQLGSHGLRLLRIKMAKTEYEKTQIVLEDDPEPEIPPADVPNEQTEPDHPAASDDAPPVFDLRGADVGGTVSMRDGFMAAGEVRLVGARIGLDLWCTDAVMVNVGRVALNAQGLEVNGNVLFHTGLVVRGEACLLGARISGQLDSHRASFTNENGFALRAHSLTVGGTMAFHDGAAAVGEANLSGSDIGGDLDCRGANFDNPDGQAFSLQGARVRGTFFWGPFGVKPGSTTDYFLFGDFNTLYADPPAGRVDFTGARVGILDDHWSAWEGNPDLKLDGFVYDLLGDGAAHQSYRVRWLAERARQRPEIDQRTREALSQAVSNLPDYDYGSYNPQVFEQLATVYDRMGNDAASRSIRIEKQRAARDSGRLGRGERLANVLLDRTIRYGWEPWRVVVFGLAIVFFGALLFGSVGAAGFQSQGQRSPGAAGSFQAVAYSLDVFLPVIDLGQGDDWVPKTTVVFRPFGWSTSGTVVETYIWVHIALGWIVSTLAVVAFTGLVRKKS